MIWLTLERLRDMLCSLKQTIPWLIWYAVMWIFTLLPGAKPFILPGDDYVTWSKLQVGGFMLVWSFYVFGFLQKPISYQKKNEVSGTGNKSIWIFLSLVVIFGLFLLLQLILMYSIDWRVSTLCAAIQILPFFLGRALEGQVGVLVPRIISVSILVLSILAITVGP